MNPNIAMSFQRPTFDPMQGQRNALAIRSSQLQEAAGAYKLRTAVDESKRSNRQRNALANLDTSAPDYYEQARGVYAETGDVDMAMKLDTHLGTLKDAERKRATTEIDDFVKIAPLLMDQSTYGQGRELASRISPHLVARLPEAFSAEIVPSVERLALGAKGWLTKQNADREHRLADNKFQYEQKHDQSQLAVERDKIAAQRADTVAKGTRANNKVVFDLQKQYRSDRNIDSFRTISQATRTLMAALKRAPGSAPATLAAGTAFMKLLDPGSVVRETELGLALSAQGLLDRFDALMQRTDHGKVMSSAQAKEFRELTAEIYDAAEAQYRDAADFYSSMAEDAGIPRERVIQDYAIPPEVLGREPAAKSQVERRFGLRPVHEN